MNYIRFILIALLIVGGCSNVLAEETLTITMHVEQAGTLQTMMDAKIAISKQKIISKLIVSGEINGDDIRFIRNLAGGPSFYVEEYDAFFGSTGILSDLDISNTTIVEGGRPYFYYDPILGKNDNRLTENNIITKEMFYFCKHLTSIKLPNSITEIRDFAFRNTKLKEITIPKNVSIIESEAFCGCDSLMNIFVANGNVTYKSLNGVLYSADKTAIIRCPQKKSGLYVIDDNVSKISYCAFQDCKQLKTVILPKNLEEKKPWAFAGCSLTDLYVQNKIPIDAYFTNFNLGTCILHVPEGSYEKYYLAPSWGDFVHIQEYKGEATKNELVIPQGLSISAETNGIGVNSELEVLISIYSISGQLIYHRSIVGHEQILLPKGIYIIVLDNYTQKVRVG